MVAAQNRDKIIHQGQSILIEITNNYKSWSQFCSSLIFICLETEFNPHVIQPDVITSLEDVHQAQMMECDTSSPSCLSFCKDQNRWEMRLWSFLLITQVFFDRKVFSLPWNSCETNQQTVSLRKSFTVNSVKQAKLLLAENWTMLLINLLLL